MSKKKSSGVFDWVISEPSYNSKPSKRNTSDAINIIILSVALFVVGILMVHTVKAQYDSNKVSTVVSSDMTKNIVLNDNIEYVSYVVGDYEYTDIELLTMTSLPTVISVRVVYKDGSELYKPAYVCYDDVDNVVYEDNTYGKVVLPQ